MKIVKKRKGGRKKVVDEFLSNEHRRSQHRESEKRRRKKENHNYLRLKTIIGAEDDVDKARVLAMAGDCITKLKQRIKDIEQIPVLNFEDMTTTSTTDDNPPPPKEPILLSDYSFLLAPDGAQCI